MASGDVFESARVRDFMLQNGLAQDYDKPRAVGPVLGFPLSKKANDGFYLLFKVPNNGTPLSTGITVEVATVDDPNNPDPGKVFRLGISGARIQSGTTNIASVSLGAETTVDVTGASTSGVVTVGSGAITKANLNNPAAGDLVLLYVRRVATAAQDAHQGVPLVTGVVIKDT